MKQLPTRSKRNETLFPYTTRYRSRRHGAGVNTGANPNAVACAGFVPFAMMAADDGSYGYEREIIVPVDSAIQSPADLKGKTLAFTAPTSNSGFKAPSAILRADFGLEADKDRKSTRLNSSH